ncbi:MAG: CBS domain-containing protein [Oscillatoriaceae cyanobacterium]
MTMDIILCHTTADFDTVGAAVGMTRLLPGSRIVLTGGAHPGVRDFLALHRDEYRIIERRSVNSKQIRSLTIVDTQYPDRLGKCAEWLNLPVPIQVWDHHPRIDGEMGRRGDGETGGRGDGEMGGRGDGETGGLPLIPASTLIVEAVGATTTLVVEALQRQYGDKINLTPPEATVMALGIHVDTGSLTFDHTTPRDAAALTWLMERGASVPVIAEYLEPGLGSRLQELLAMAMEQMRSEQYAGNSISMVLLDTESYVPGLSSLASSLMDLTETDALLLGARYRGRPDGGERLAVIGRSRIKGTNLHQLFQPLGGGGHPRAASVVLRDTYPETALEQLWQNFKAQIPLPLRARDLMSSPVRTILPQTTIHEAQRILLRYGHSGLSVIDDRGMLVGVIARRDLDLALHHGFSHAPVKGYMTSNVKTITPDTPFPEIEEMMVTYDIGRLPVLEDSQLVGIVTRTDVLRQLHQDKTLGGFAQDTSFVNGGGRRPYCLLPAVVREMLQKKLVPQQWRLLQLTAEMAASRGWQLYLVGGAVRDLFLASNDDEPLCLKDIDLVVDGFHTRADRAAGVELAKALQAKYPNCRLEIHGSFQTAALLWHKDPELDSLWIDIATARTEFYPKPAANPEVEASSIRQDLYRRDFTINALALLLTGGERAGEILDFFGGLLDLQDKCIRVLHPNSFIEDPTRIYRAVRFAVRLGFDIDAQTQSYIRHAIESGVYQRVQGEGGRAPALEARLKTELKYILEADNWQKALRLLGSLDALRCIHPELELSRELWRRLRLMERLLRPQAHTGRLSKFTNVSENLQWQMRLEVLIAYLPEIYRGKVAAQLQLNADSIKRLERLGLVSSEITAHLHQAERPSHLMQALHKFDVPTLLLIAVASGRQIRRQIWQYLNRWLGAKPILDGNDLKALGYKPGNSFKQILDALLAATVDGEINTPEEAKAFLAARFPR